MLRDGILLLAHDLFTCVTGKRQLNSRDDENESFGSKNQRTYCAPLHVDVPIPCTWNRYLHIAWLDLLGASARAVLMCLVEQTKLIDEPDE